MEKRNTVISLIPFGQIPEVVSLFFERNPGSVCSSEGKLYLLTDSGALSCTDDRNGSEILEAVRRKIRTGLAEDGKSKDVWYQILITDDPDRVLSLTRRHGIDDRKERIVIVFRVKTPPDQPLNTIFREIAPTEEADRLIALDDETLVLVRQSDYRTEDEIAEYSAAVIDTMVSEGFTDLQAGIGEKAENIAGLHRSYMQAQNSLAIGIQFSPKGTVFRYSQQKLERIISAIPAVDRDRIVRDFFTGRNGSAFDEETIETVRIFFRNDLNITAASRELFIHRNTLNYRLDKIKRETGLDLRTFRDAVVFRLVCGMADTDALPKLN